VTTSTRKHARTPSAVVHSGPAGASPAELGGDMAKKGETQGNDWAVTTVRLRRDQWQALSHAAVTRAAKEGGKPDASAIVREALDKLLHLKAPPKG